MKIIVLLAKIGALKPPPGINPSAHAYQISRVDKWEESHDDWRVLGVFTERNISIAAERAEQQYQDRYVTFKQEIVDLDFLRNIE